MQKILRRGSQLVDGIRQIDPPTTAPSISGSSVSRDLALGGAGDLTIVAPALAFRAHTGNATPIRDYSACYLTSEVSDQGFY
jgi:hypothetical protein